MSRRLPGRDRIPSIVVAPTPANDLYLMLSDLLPTEPLVRFVSDPAAFLHDHRAEIRLVGDFLRGWEAPGEVPASEASDSHRTTAPAVTVRAMEPRRRGGGESLLR